MRVNSCPILGGGFTQRKAVKAKERGKGWDCFSVPLGSLGILNPRSIHEAKKSACVKFAPCDVVVLRVWAIGWLGIGFAAAGFFAFGVA